jgi:formyltetrahydrofolate-dependent phosphoribosylglycinamide formyltransferase
MSAAILDLAVLVSGSGTTLQNLIERTADVGMRAKIRLVIGSRPGLLGVQRAIDAGIPTVVVDRREFAEVGSFSRAVFAEIDRHRIDLVCLAGWLCLLEIPPRPLPQIMNIHPALLPKFGGRGMYGRHVHEAVLKAGEKISGCTVHYVDNQYDHGPIILQRTCPVLPGDTPETLATRVFEQEKIAYPEAIRQYGQLVLM